MSDTPTHCAAWLDCAFSADKKRIIAAAVLR
jgi:hypothetical protein